MRQNGRIVLASCVALLLAHTVTLAQPTAGTAFTYQGFVTGANGPVTGNVDLRFRLFDAASGGTQVAPEAERRQVAAADGVFTVTVDFGASAFNGAPRWLELCVGEDAPDPNAPSNCTTLSPRQPVTATPYALFAAAPWKTTSGGVFYSGGNVGIGIAAPTSPLEVAGEVRASSLIWDNAGRLTENGSLELGAPGGQTIPPAGTMPRIDFHFGRGVAENFNFRILNDADKSLLFAARDEGAVFILNGRNITKPANDGEVLINKTGPGAAVRIVGGEAANLQCDRADTAGAASIRFLTGGATSWAAGLVRTGNDFRIRNLTTGAGEDAINIGVTGNRVGIGRVAATNRLEVEGNVASKTVAGDWAANSDRRIKTRIIPIAGALDVLAQVSPCSFEYTDEYTAAHSSIEQKRYENVIAQEFATVFPDYVKGSGEFLSDGSEILQVDTHPLKLYSVVAINELHDMVKLQRRELDELRAQLREIRAEIARSTGSNRP